ncbi:MAG TPA: alpha/beta hydrolase [Gemmatimonadaceae bacterium]|nr:alpha/beta hydrolase [Gemmatimonadaceae bacterium]
MAGVIEESLRLPAFVWRGIMLGLLETEAAVSLGRSGIPALVVWGGKDNWPPRAEQDSLVARLRTATLAVSEETGHAPHWERPDEFARTLQRFIRETRPTGE